MKAAGNRSSEKSRGKIKQYTYGYDSASNRTSELVTTTTTTSSPNNVNEIVSQSGGTSRTLTYDLDGSMINDGRSRTFEWDGANRLVAINYTGTSNRTELSYDGLNRVAKIVEKTGSTINSTRKIVWCGTEMCEYRDANDSLTLRLYPQGQYSNKAYFYTRDHLGSIREMLSNTESVVGRYDYDPYGRSTTVVSSTLPDFNFTGFYRHSPSGLDLAVRRAYDPDLGRWLSRDPLPNSETSQGPNLYSYVQNNPIRGMDPEGTDTNLNNEDYLWATGRPVADANKQIRQQNQLIEDWTKNYFDAFLGVGNRSWKAFKEGKYFVDIAWKDFVEWLKHQLEEETKKRCSDHPE
jgi:RHS repeat-associated protein